MQHRNHHQHRDSLPANGDVLGRFQDPPNGARPPDPGNGEAHRLAGAAGFEGDQGKADKRDSDATSASPQALPTMRSQRQRRVLVALLTGPKTREQLDRIAGASNSPDVVLRLRRRFGLLLPCTLGSVTDLDGQTVERGVYHLADTDRQTAQALTARGAA